MKSPILPLILTIFAVLGISQLPPVAAMLRGQGQSMTYQELFTKTLEALAEVRGLEWSPGMDYKYNAAFSKAPDLTLNKLNDILPPIFQKHGLQFAGFQTGDRSSGGGVTAPGLEDYYMDVEYSQYALSLNLRGKRFYVGIVENPNNAVDLEPYAYRSLGETSKIIAARLVGNAAAIQQRIDCSPPSEGAYCATTKKSAREILDWFIDTYSPSDRLVMLKGFASGKFQFSDKTQITKSLYVSIDFKKLKTTDTYQLWDSDYKRKNFTITYTPSSSIGKNVLRVEASWVDGYTPSPEEK